jgi:phage/plasmid-like protein (TIGR03299 family)
MVRAGYNIFTAKSNETITSFQEALNTFQLNWEVGLRPLFTAVSKEHGTEEVEDYKAVVRLDTNAPLAVVGNRYVPTQNSNNEVATLMDIVVKEMGAKYTSGGSFDFGNKVYLQIELPDVLRVKNTDDIIKKYLLYSNSHNGSSQISLGDVMTRVVCLNTFVMATNQVASQYRIRHTSNSEVRLKEIKDIILQTLNYYKQVELKVNWLADQKFTDLQMELAMRKVFGVDEKLPVEDISTRTRNNMETVRDLFESGTGLDQWRGTAWAAANAFTEFSNHSKTVKGETPETRKQSVLFGSAASFNVKAFNVVESMLTT